MSTSYRLQLQRLRALILRCDATDEGMAALSAAHERIAALPLPKNPLLVEYANLLLLAYAYSPASAQRERLTKIIQEFSVGCRRLFAGKHSVPANEGLPFQPTETSFSPAFVRWMLQHPDLVVECENFGDSSTVLNSVLGLSMSPILRSETSAGADNATLLHSLHVPPESQLSFIAQQCARFAAIPGLEDYFFEKLELTLRVKPLHASFSRLSNRLSFATLYDHHDLLKRFDHEELMSRELPAARALHQSEHAELVMRIKNAMLLTARETDPATFLDEASLRYYEVERGIGIALYGIQSERQLPLESYIGFTLFKNGLPCAYGGGWVFGTHANFGINIHEAFRGGESGYILCQLLRVYTQLFKLESIEVEAYQYGLDNPEGISSAAFWFYYRFGFRPIDGELAKLALHEEKRMRTQKGYRSSERTLKKFTGSNLIRAKAKAKPIRVGDVSARVLKMINKHYHSNDTLAEDAARRAFLHALPTAHAHCDECRWHFDELALWALAANTRSTEDYARFFTLCRLKAHDPYTYQSELRALIGDLKSRGFFKGRV